MTTIPIESKVRERIATLTELAERDLEAARYATWAWLADLGRGLPGLEAEAELSEIYAAGAPADVDGETEGMLIGFVTPVGLDRFGSIIRTVAPVVIDALPEMPWLGKKFDKAAGHGTNAVTGTVAAFAKLLDPFYRFTKAGDHYEGFEMRNWVEASVIAPDTQVLVLDYENYGDNPWPVNRIRDEAVQVVPGVLLGAKLWHQPDGYHQFAWWAARAPIPD